MHVAGSDSQIASADPDDEHAWTVGPEEQGTARADEEPVGGAADDVETKPCRAARQDERVARRAGDEPRVGELHGARVAVDDERAVESAAAAANDAV